MQDFSRRSFLTIAAGAAIAPPISWAAEDVPLLLDHILLGCNDLERGIAFVEEHTGVRAAFGGVHPGRGTQNALLSLGTRRYLEIMTPDPAQPDAKDPLVSYLKKLSEPRLVNWAAHPGDLGALAKKLREAGIAFEGPTPGSRKRPDGRVLQWQTLTLKDNASWTLPFFIDWSADSPHPSEDAPKGCSLVHFQVVTPDPGKLTKMTTLLGLNLSISKGEKPLLIATIAGRETQFIVTS
jgi:catechol 2,3-dioxygenase-like lactoylglutathione lyase family enzyme